MFVRYCCILLVLFSVLSCKQLTKATDFITQPTAREVYARNFKDDSIFFPKWQNAYSNSFHDSIMIKLPYREKGLFRPSNYIPNSYNIELRQGEQFEIKVKTDSVSERVFINAFLWNSEAPKDSKDIAENEREEKSLSFYVEESGTYKVIVQSEMALYSNFELVAHRKPTYHFPVSGKGNAAIQSFWGAPRGGGTRTHQGIDIFAKRGTPVVAVVDGRISFVGERGLGGKQVWLREGLLGNSLYYAHLDSISARSGQKVRIGDTLGFVGNSGNARTTAPHLHFGIYKRIGGAVDPLPFVKRMMPNEDFEQAEPLEFGVVNSSIANLRIASFANADKIGEVKRNDTLLILGRANNWLHVKTPSGKKAFVYEALISP